jgi:putative hydrolase of the HAD superfamily
MINWQNIESVLLDMDGTLLDLNFDNHFWLEFVPKRYAERHRLTLEEAQRHLKPRFHAIEGRLEWYCLDYWSNQLNLDIIAMKVEIAELISVLPHVPQFLGRIRNLRKRLILVTNAHPKSLALKMERTLLRSFFDQVISSHTLGYPKENPEFWTKLQEIELFNPKLTLLIDDSLTVLRAARQFGIEHLVAIRKNDSRRAPRDIAEFPAVEDLRELMP